MHLHAERWGWQVSTPASVRLHSPAGRTESRPCTISTAIRILPSLFSAKRNTFAQRATSSRHGTPCAKGLQADTKEAANHTNISVRPVQAEAPHAVIKTLRRLKIEGAELGVVLVQRIVLLCGAGEGVHAFNLLAHVGALHCKLLHMRIGPKLTGAGGSDRVQHDRVGCELVVRLCVIGFQGDLAGVAQSQHAQGLAAGACRAPHTRFASRSL